MKKKVLFINNHMNVGGVEKSLLDVLQHFDFNKFDVDLLLLQEKGDYFNELPRNVNVYLYSLNDSFGALKKIVRCAVKRKDWFSLKFRIIYLLASKVDRRILCLAKKMFCNLQPRYDTIIAYRPGICTYLAAYAFESENKISWWHHGEMNYVGEAAVSLNNAYKKMNHIVAVSHSSAEILKKSFPQNKDKIIVIPNMIPIDTIQVKANEYRIDFNANLLNIISIGRMSPEKNMCLCPFIGEELKKRAIQFRWYLIGDGEEYDAIKHLIHEKNLEDSFVMTGRLNNPYPYIKKATIMIHPSLVESQGITILEGMTMGIPVIAVKSDGPKEFIENGINGYLVDNNPKEIADILNDAIIRREALRVNGMRTVKKYNPSEVEEKINQLISGE